MYIMANTLISMNRVFDCFVFSYTKKAVGINTFGL